MTMTNMYDVHIVDRLSRYQSSRCSGLNLSPVCRRMTRFRPQWAEWTSHFILAITNPLVLPRTSTRTTVGNCHRRQWIRIRRNLQHRLRCRERYPLTTKTMATTNSGTIFTLRSKQRCCQSSIYNCDFRSCI